MVQRVRSQRDQVAAAQELKKLVYYSNFVLTPLVEEIDPAVAEENKKRAEQAEIMEIMAKAQDEEETLASPSSSDAAAEATPSTLKKAKSGDSKQSAKERGQKVITLKDEMEIRDRQDLYRQYLLYCMQGEVRKLGMGS